MTSHERNGYENEGLSVWGKQQVKRTESKTEAKRILNLYVLIVTLPETLGKL